MLKTYKLTEKADKAFKSLKQKFEYSTYSDCIVAIDSFFTKNIIKPSDQITTKEEFNINTFQIFLMNQLKEQEDKNLQNTLLLKKFISDDSQSLRKRHGEIEKLYLKPLMAISEQIYNTSNNLDISEHKNVSLYPKEITNKYNQDRIDELEDMVEKLKRREQISIEYSKKKDVHIQDAQNKTRECLSMITTLYKNIVTEKNGFKTKVIINLPLEELEKMFDVLEETR